MMDSDKSTTDKGKGEELGTLYSFSNDGTEAIHRQIQIDESILPSSILGQEENCTDEELIEQFELDKCCDWIKGHNYTKVCLQFPDHLLQFSTRILFILESMINNPSSTKIYILADSTYGSCCVDEKTAKHVAGDAILHFGPSCLTETNNSVPVLYIFTRPKLGASAILDLQNVFQQQIIPTTTTTKILILYDVIYAHFAQEAYSSTIASKFPNNVILSELVLPGTTATTADQKQDHGGQDNSSTTTTVLYGRKIPSNLSQFSTILYIGSNPRTILNFRLSSSLASKVFLVYNPANQSLSGGGAGEGDGIDSQKQLTKLLMKRTYYIEKLKDSSSVGILVGTLAVEKYLDIISQLKSLLRSVGKSVYIVSIGEITPPKLANFPDIQIFILISCPECLILDSKEFYQPIISPYEVELAFNKEREWSVNLINDFRVLLPGGAQHVPLNMTISDPENQTPDVSLITGGSRSVHTSQEQEQESQQQEYWQGLNIHEESSHSGKVVEGKTGIPRNYTSEPI